MTTYYLRVQSGWLLMRSTIPRAAGMWCVDNADAMALVRKLRGFGWRIAIIQECFPR